MRDQTTEEEETMSLWRAFNLGIVPSGSFAIRDDALKNPKCRR